MRRVFVVSLMTATLLAFPAAARADGGGAFISLDHTYYVVGDSVVATAFATVPKSRSSTLARGPFYAYVLDDRSWIRSGQPVPGSAIRVATFMPDHQGMFFQFEARFTMPVLSPGWYHVAFCNDPCTIDGFREPLRGQFSVVATAREGQLLIETSRLHGRLSAAQREISKTERRLHATEQDLASSQRQASRWGDDVLTLGRQLAAVQEDAAAAQARSRTEHQAALIVGAELVIGALALVILRRTRRSRRAKPRGGSDSAPSAAQREMALSQR